jgi:hypothetical protein
LGEISPSPDEGGLGFREVPRKLHGFFRHHHKKSRFANMPSPEFPRSVIQTGDRGPP